MKSPVFILLVLICAPVSAGVASFAWDPNDELDLAGYRLHQGLQSQTYDISLDVGLVTEATVGDLSPGSTYYFAVTAFNTFGMESLPSNEVSYTVPVEPPPPPPPPVQIYYQLPSGKRFSGNTINVTTGSGALRSWIGTIQVVTEILTDHFLRPATSN